MDFGSGQYIWKLDRNEPDRGYVAASDSRRDGLAAGVPGRQLPRLPRLRQARRFAPRRVSFATAVVCPDPSCIARNTASATAHQQRRISNGAPATAHQQRRTSNGAPATAHQQQQ
jgi:hypothetical protein